MLRFALVVSRFNEEVTGGLRKGALEYLQEKGIKVQETDIYEAPGAYEIPLIAKHLAKSGKYSGVVCLGCVIKGDTAHFEFISLGAAVGIMQGMLETETPIAYGILNTYTDAQALERSQPGPHNKGRETAAACFETVHILKRIKESHS